ncbi:MAG: hypothetical protein H6835_13275 [Planctomycetes bacterium]|nr:hypothetical protein [Planctomycetota bacterium]
MQNSQQPPGSGSTRSTKRSTPLHSCLLAAMCAVASALPATAQELSPPPPANPYKLEPFHEDYPAELEYPQRGGLDFEGTRRQILQRLADHLQGNVSPAAWHLATEFYWRAPEDAIEPLIDTMDRSLGNPAFGDVVKNCAEAMGHMAREEFDGALQRALQHKSEAARQAAYAALARCGKAESVRRLAADFTLMDGRAREAWLSAVRERLPDERVAMLRAVYMAPYPKGVREQVMQQLQRMPASEAAEVMRGRWEEPIDEYKAIIAGALHAAGDGAGTAWIQDALRGEDTRRMLLAIQRCIFGTDPSVLGALREDLLRATTHLRAEVRLEAARQLARLPGDDIADVFEVLTAPSESWEVRSLALRELTRRGRGAAVAVLLEELPTATGLRLQELLSQLAASGDPRAVPVLVERFAAAPEKEGRPFLQALAQNGSAAAARALTEIFLGPEKLVYEGDIGRLTTRNYVPKLLLNLRGPEQEILDTYAALPRAQWRERALLLPTLAGIAADRVTDKALQQRCTAPLREILFDKAELPQLRVHALNLLARKWMTIEEVLRLKAQRFDEQAGLRVLFTDFLRENF